ncbi:MAG: restriction endonuclease, SacI family [Armatimonadetes bacterium]|nr:restriction endonuclease, SacI family [Armatimonadota bacterium]
MLDYILSRELLETAFAFAEQAMLSKSPPHIDPEVKEACDRTFQSSTQAYREVLLGCTIARLQDETIDVRLPYVDQGPAAFGGRSLDERVVNPFLQSKRIPCSRGPYLSVFRRSVRFNPATRAGLRDKEGYDALLAALAYLEVSNSNSVNQFLLYQLYKFVELREATNIPLSKLFRISLEQYRVLLTGLLATASGGLFPVLLALATFRAIKEFFQLDWEVSCQGINVSDAASGASGDITIVSGGQIVLAVEVTERTVDKSRVVSTFNTKVAPYLIGDYLFFLADSDSTVDAKLQAQQYFAQGHEVNFVDIKNWILMLLATMGTHGRDLFNKELMVLLEASDVPQALRVAWNHQVSALTSRTLLEPDFE